MFAPSVAATAAASRQFPPNSLLLNPIQPQSPQLLLQHQQHHLQQPHHASATASLCNQFSLPPSLAPVQQYSALHNGELARQLLSAELATRLVHDRMLLASPDGAQQISNFVQGYHGSQSTSRQKPTSTPTDAAMLHQHFMSAVAAAAGTQATVSSGLPMTGPMQLPSGSFTANLHQLMQLSSGNASSHLSLPGRTPGIASVAPPLDPLSDASAAAALVAGLPGAFQPKGGHDLMEVNTRPSSTMLPPGVRDRNHATSMTSSNGLPSGRVCMKPKSGNWCAAHVRTAWAIHVRQQYAKQQAAAAAASAARSKEQFHSPAVASGDLSPLPLSSQLYAQATGPSSGLKGDHRSPGLNGLSNTDDGLVARLVGRSPDDIIQRKIADKKRKAERKAGWESSPQARKVEGSAFSVADGDECDEMTQGSQANPKRSRFQPSSEERLDVRQQHAGDGNRTYVRSGEKMDARRPKNADDVRDVLCELSTPSSANEINGIRHHRNVVNDDDDERHGRHPTNYDSRSLSTEESNTECRRAPETDSYATTRVAQRQENQNGSSSRVWNPFFRVDTVGGGSNGSSSQTRLSTTSTSVGSLESLQSDLSGTSSLSTIETQSVASLARQLDSVADSSLVVNFVDVENCE